MFYAIAFVVIALAFHFRAQVKTIVLAVTAWCAHLNKGTSEISTLSQRIFYFLTRHIIWVLMAVVSLTVMWYLSSIDSETIKTMTESYANKALSIGMFVLTLKFIYSKLEIQNAALKSDIVLGCLIIALAWLCK
jgi:hypothetical protein